MKMLCQLAFAAAVLTATTASAAEEPAPALKPNALLGNMETLLSESNRISYAIGVNVARNLEANFTQLHFDFFLLGLRDVFSKERLKLNEDEINRSIARYTEISTAHVRKQFDDFKVTNLQTAEQFLEQNRAKEGVVTLPSGLQYRVLSPGTADGPFPKEEGMAIVEYHGKSLSGRTAESTLTGDRKGPVTIPIKEALPFWREILPKMAIGAKWEVYVHPKLAYGDKGGGKAEPNELLVYQVEVVGLQ
jgi:FKBP-type peptidyl-prolyl cis-trans isomerase FklB